MLGTVSVHAVFLAHANRNNRFVFAVVCALNASTLTPRRHATVAAIWGKYRHSLRLSLGGLGKSLGNK